ncbi:hypothetical protein MHU86_12158 [Fragilaria crotonensis]|nr:hypothetical protein MHU86_12158 [Fragilaria crotonensis]
MRATLHAIDEVFRPLDPTDPPDRKEPASVKKMLKGDAQWSTFKRILGWDIDTETSTLHLPIHRVDRLRELLSWLSLRTHNSPSNAGTKCSVNCDPCPPPCQAPEGCSLFCRQPSVVPPGIGSAWDSTFRMSPTYTSPRVSPNRTVRRWRMRRMSNGNGTQFLVSRI